jgi:phage-related minor tail protein
MAFKLAEAYVEFSQKGVSAVTAGANKASSAFKSATSSVSALTAGVVALGAAGALRSLWGFVEAAAEAEKQTAKLEAVLKSTGGVSGQTVESLEAHASALQRVTAFEDDTVKGAQAVLLTFKKIGGETFPQATEAALDLATVFEGDLRGSALMVGKALEDPIRGITALRRAGVSFTKDQQEVIKSLVETGQVAQAQGLILKEISSQVGGSARKVGDTTFGQIEQLKNEMGDLAELIGGELTPVVRTTVEAIKAWKFMLGGQAAMEKEFGSRAADMGKRFMGAKSASEAEAVQKEYFAMRKEFAGMGMQGTPSSMFGSRAANAHLASLRDAEDQNRRQFGAAAKLGGKAADVAGAIGGSAIGPAKALADTIGAKITRESEWLRKQFDTSLRQERLLQNIYDRLAPTEQAPRFQ